VTLSWAYWKAIDTLLKLDQQLGILLDCLSLVHAMHDIFQTFESHAQGFEILVARICTIQQFLHEAYHNQTTDLGIEGLNGRGNVTYAKQKRIPIERLSMSY